MMTLKRWLHMNTQYFFSLPFILLAVMAIGLVQRHMHGKGNLAIQCIPLAEVAIGLVQRDRQMQGKGNYVDLFSWL